MKLKMIVALLAVLALQVQAQMTIAGRQPVYDSLTDTYLLTLPDSLFGKSCTLQASFADSISWMTVNGKQIRNSVTLPMVSGDAAYPIMYLYNGRLYTSTLRLTNLPILRIDGDFGEEYALGRVEMLFPDSIGSRTYNARIKWAGTPGVNKHNFHIKFVDDSLNKINVSFFGLRDDNHWRLDAGTVDMLRIRNKAAHSLWASFGTRCYYQDKHSKARSYARGQHVEMFLNGEYAGFYDMTEYLDRKQMKLKKYDDLLDEFHGLMWKAKEGTPQTLFSRTTTVNNSLPNWGGFDVMYPDIDEVSPTDYSVLRNAVAMVASSNDSTFAQQVGDYFDLPVLVDYYVFMQTLFAIDNTSKNIIWGCYDKAVDKKLTLSVWDLDATVGQTWYDGPGFYHADEIQPENDLDSIPVKFTLFSSSRLWQRLKRQPDFMNQAVGRYHELRQTVLHPDSLVEHYASIVRALDRAGALAREQERWSGGSDIYNRELDFAGELDYLSDWLRRRIAYMDKNTFGRELVPGDINGDGNVTINDLSWLVDYLLTGVEGGSNFNIYNADVDQDGIIGVTDLTALIDILLGA